MTWFALFIPGLLLPAFLALDLLYRARPVRRVPGWRARALVVALASFAISLGVGLAWGSAFRGHALFDGAALGLVGGAACGVLVYELFHYTYHRCAHEFAWLWRVHQMHHSAESVDAWGAYYLHPLDVLAFTSGSSLVLYPLLGLSPASGAMATSFITFAAIFQHANLKTPRWAGFVVQRPESHAIHHASGVHKLNYANLPLWDMLFGTFSNPRSDAPASEPGFYFGASRRWQECLLLRDVTQPTAAKQ